MYNVRVTNVHLLFQAARELAEEAHQAGRHDASADMCSAEIPLWLWHELHDAEKSQELINGWLPVTFQASLDEYAWVSLVMHSDDGWDTEFDKTVSVQLRRPVLDVMREACTSKHDER